MVLDLNVVLAAEPVIKLNVEDELESGSSNEPVEWEGNVKLDDNVLDSVVVASNDCLPVIMVGLTVLDNEVVELVKEAISDECPLPDCDVV